LRAPRVAREVGGGNGIRGRSGVRRAAAQGQCNVRGRLKCKKWVTRPEDAGRGKQEVREWEE
jgi:hypothetical protein